MDAKRRIAIVSLYLLAIAGGVGVGLVIVAHRDPGTPVTPPRMAAGVPDRDRGATPGSSINPSDPLAAARWAYHVPVGEIPTWIGRLNSTEHHMALDTLFDRWSQVDPAAAMGAALALESVGKIDMRDFGDGGWGNFSMSPLLRILVTISKNWLEADPDAAMAALVEMPEEFPERRDLLEQTLAGYAVHRPADAVRIAFEELGARGKIKFEHSWSIGDEGLLRQLFGHWGTSAPRAAVARAMEIPDRVLRENALHGAFDGWSEVDAAAAREWFQSLAPGDQSDTLWNAMLTSLARTNPLEALELSQATGKGSDLKSITRDWAKSDVEGMIRSAELLKDPDTRTFLAAWGFEQMAQDHSGAEMAALAMELPTDVQQSALKMIAWHWGEQDAAAAEAWGLRQEDPVLRRQFLREFYNQQIAEAPAAAAAGVSRIPDATLRNMMALEVAGAWGRESPSRAAEWAVSSPQGLAPGTLAKVQETVANRWAWNSVPEALEWYGTLTDQAIRNAAGNGIAYVLARKQHENGIDCVALIEAAPGLSREDHTQIQNRILEQAKLYGIGR